MAIALGDTLLIEGHLFVVLSDPQQNPDRIVLAMLTTLEDWKDDSCTLNPGDHPFICHPTCVDYAGRQGTPAVETLESGLKAGTIRRQEPLQKEVLLKVLKGADESDFIPMGHWRLLDDQNLFDQTRF